MKDSLTMPPPSTQRGQPMKSIPAGKYFISDEFAWIDVKNNGVGRNVICDEADIGRAVHSRLRLLQRNPEKILSFFRGESTAYAA